MWYAPFAYDGLILDGGHPELRREWYLRSACPDSIEYLYLGTRFAGLLEVSPFIVATSESDPFARWLYEHFKDGGRGHNWGCFWVCPEGPATVAAHFRKWITIYDDIGAEVFFRFYDPDVLPSFVDALNAHERSLFFGPVRALMTRQPGKDLLAARVRRDPAVIAESSSDFALADDPPSFTLMDRHIARMRDMYWKFLVQEVLEGLIPNASPWLAHLDVEHLRNKTSECLEALALLEGVLVPEVEEGITFCLLSMTACSHFYESPPFQSCLRKMGMSAALEEWKTYARAPILGIEDFHDPLWLPMPEGERA